MAQKYKKIKFNVQGTYDEINEDWLYVRYCTVSDYTSFYDSHGNFLFSYPKIHNNIMDALIVATSDWNDDRLQPITMDEIHSIKI